MTSEQYVARASQRGLLSRRHIVRPGACEGQLRDAIHHLTVGND